MKIVHVVGARPNFMKVAPVIAALEGRPNVVQVLVHTGQHYDANMSEVFFRQLGIPEPDLNLEVGSASHAVQTARIMIQFERVVLREKPDWVMVYGDINSTMAAAVVCSKLGIPLAHVEAGLRSRDRTMPEEINRLVTDRLADLLFTPSLDGNENLAREGVSSDQIHFVGNVMIDTLARLLPKAAPPPVPDLDPLYALVTLHRPSNVDDPAMLAGIVATLRELSQHLQIVFPIHPRTRRRLAEFAIDAATSRRFLLLEPMGYLEFLALQQRAGVAITDSGGIQEETTWLGIPCLTLRENTERPVTVTKGSNILVGRDMDKLKGEVHAILEGRGKKGRRPDLWDGRSGERIAEIIGTKAHRHIGTEAQRHKGTEAPRHRGT